MLGPRAPLLDGPWRSLGRAIPEYDLFLIVVGPVVLGAALAAGDAHALRRADPRRDARIARLVAALGVSQALLLPAVFALGAGLAGLGGALQIPREPANLGHGPRRHGRGLRRHRRRRDGSDARRVPGGAGHRPHQGRLHRPRHVEIAGVAIAFPKLTLVVVFLVMAVVLVVSPGDCSARRRPRRRRAAAGAACLASPAPGGADARGAVRRSRAACRWSPTIT